MERDGGATPKSALDDEGPVVPLHDAVHHPQTEPCAASALRRKKGVEAAPSHFVRHAYAAVLYIQRDLTTLEPSPERDGAALRHGIDRVQDEIGDGLAQFRLVAID